MSLFSYLRPMDETDLSTVHTIEQNAYDYPWSLQGFEKSLDQGLNYLLCSQSEEIIGYCCILPVLDEAHILNFCVSPDFHRQGVANEAFKKILSLLRESGFSVVLLEVRESNRAARCLYGKFGFNEDGIRKGYYRAQVWDETMNRVIDTKEDAVLMSYSFKKLGD